LAALSSHALNLLIGAATIAVAVVTMVAPAFCPNRSAFVTVGLLTGISETATGIGGPPLALAYQHHRPDVLRSTVAGCFLLGELLSLGVLCAMGRTTSQQMLSAALLLPFVAIGGLVSSFLRQSLNGRFLRGFVLIFAVTSGAS
ncbi:MAG TPA: TSUP family transporter, partial [Terriglobales bacterium]